MGVRKVRLTGGEPLVRHGIMTLVEALGREVEKGLLDELTLTTNGTQLARYAQALVQAGVRRINVSLDTLDPGKYETITRRGRLHQVVEGIETALEAGLKVKINTMALRGVNDGEVVDMVNWAGERGCDVTFIEVMPMGQVHLDDRANQYWPLDELRDVLEQHCQLRDIALSTGGPARYAQVIGADQRIGFITPMSHNFCSTCNRVRVNCRGELFTCLGQEGSVDLRPALRNAPGHTPLRQAIETALGNKPHGHDFGYSRGLVEGAVPRSMNSTGG
jgi:cyclic pyranopterin phosphate synthase